jgi:phosphate acetyltransferase
LSPLVKTLKKFLKKTGITESRAEAETIDIITKTTRPLYFIKLFQKWIRVFALLSFILLVFKLYPILCLNFVYNKDMNSIIKNVYEQSKLSFKKIILAEGEDPRIIAAAKIIREEKIADIIVLGKNGDIDPQTSPLLKDFAKDLYDLRKDKGLTEQEAQRLVKNPLYFGTLMVHLGMAHGMVAGSNSTTADTFKPALQIIKTKENSNIVSSFFVIETNNPLVGEEGLLFFADCALNINPSAEQLSEIALQTAKSFTTLTQKTPRIAMLSFSTHGSAKGEMVEKVQTATLLIKQKNPNLIIDGEVQADAALVPSICDTKYPQNCIHGKANILIFPDLNSGNIAYKLVERIANAKAYGPLSQAINKPVNDLSRGCSVQDIVTTVALTSLQE